MTSVHMNKYECTMDQELTSCALGGLVGSGRTLLHQLAAGGREMTSCQKSVNRFVFTWRKILPNFTTIRFEATDLRLFNSVAPTTTRTRWRRTTRWV